MLTTDAVNNVAKATGGQMRGFTVKEVLERRKQQEQKDLNDVIEELNTRLINGYVSGQEYLADTAIAEKYQKGVEAAFPDWNITWHGGKPKFVANPTA